ncbi:MAG TPA: potassium channel protein [Kofleriaceae bacterium]|nr:potassium channel protein [Kofleriaceae bacterium]
MHGGLRARLIGGLVALIVVLAAGTIGYWLLGDGRWNLNDCFYMTVVTLTTVGYAEVLEDFEHVAYAREFNVILILFGMGAFLYFVSTLTAMIVEGDLRAALRKTRMRKTIQNLEDHYVVCGTGSTGRHIIHELIATQRPVVAIDLSEEKLEALCEKSGGTEAGFYYIAGDATDDDVLVAANTANARGIVAALANDKDNLFLVVTVRQLNAKARVVARGSDLKVLEKLKRAGADTVVSPNYIGGMRMVSELVRPAVVRFLDVMLKDSKGMRIEEVEVGADSRYAGQSLAETYIRREAGVSILAVRQPGGDYVYNPDKDYVIGAGATLVVLGEAAATAKLRRLAT